MSDAIKKPEPGSPTDHSPEVSFALVLSRMIGSVEKDPALLRGTIYELARVKLLEQFGREDVKEVDRLVTALETAIEGVEAFTQQEEAVRSLIAPLPHPKKLTNSQTQIIAPDANARPPLWLNAKVPARVTTLALRQPRQDARADDDAMAEILTKRSRPHALAFTARLVAVFCLAGLAGFAAMSWPRLRSFVGVVRTAAESPAGVRPKVNPTSSSTATDGLKAPTLEAAQAAPGPSPLLPTTFGIYALSDSQLQELKQLAAKVPNPRVAVSVAINTPSETTIPGGDAKFIVFRRDAATNAPDHAEVRVVAKVTRAMGVDSAGKVNVSQTQDIWVIRNISFPYKIGPVKDHPEMFQVQPEAADFSLPAGRYALVLKGQGFDFTVAGPIKDGRQCLERLDAANGAFYSLCPGK
jgi:hypothetical protein